MRIVCLAQFLDVLQTAPMRLPLHHFRSSLGFATLVFCNHFNRHIVNSVENVKVLNYMRLSSYQIAKTMRWLQNVVAVLQLLAA
jgi:hypothetical protein